MNQVENSNYDGVLNIVRQWPSAKRMTLIQDVLETFATRVEAARPARATLKQALGLLATDQPAPTDEEVEQMLDEHRLEKYK